MNKKFLTFGILSVILIGILVPTKFAHAGIIDIALSPIFEAMGHLLMTVSSLALIFTGMVFDWIVDFSIIKMGSNLGDPNGLGGAISSAWSALRDVANMVFIFVLLFTAFKAMFDTDFGVSGFGKQVKNIIIIALLINFSLFFSKVVIDASNIVAVGFYKAIAGANETKLESSTVIGGTSNFKGISGGYMRMLGLQTFYSANILDSANGEATKILTLGIASSVFMLVAAVIFLLAGVMFATRFIILIFLMILSPLALIAYIIPGQKGQFDKWKDALIDQSFFAPIYFAMTWVVFKIGSSLIPALQQSDPTKEAVWTNIATDPKSAMALVVNYVLIIGFSIAALIFSKSMASKTPGFGIINKGVGAAAFGTAAFGLRSSVGFAGKRLAENSALQKGTKSTNIFARTGARAALYASEKARSASFDVRNAKVPTSVIGDMIQGTIGRTGFGKALGLNDVNIPSIDVGQRLAGKDFGTAGTKGYKELKEESDKRIREREAKATSEFVLAEARENVKKGARDGANPTEIEAMEKALAKLSEKETESLVASNRELLESQNFANAISVKQLEAINKSDQITDEQKGKLKDARFKEIEAINDPAGLAALAIPAAARTPAQIVDAERVEKARKRVKGLADSELEMINPNYLDSTRPEGREFISQLKGGQVDAINKSSKFSSTQKKMLAEERMRPLLEALATGNVAVSRPIVRKADIKTKVGYMKPVGMPPIVIATHPDILETYSIKTLQRMAGHDDMTDNDISTLRAALLATLPAGNPVVTWLNDPVKGMVEFPG